jgi:hypothetical protein
VNIEKSRTPLLHLLAATPSDEGMDGPHLYVRDVRHAMTDLGNQKVRCGRPLELKDYHFSFWWRIRNLGENPRRLTEQLSPGYIRPSRDAGGLQRFLSLSSKFCSTHDSCGSKLQVLTDALASSIPREVCRLSGVFMMLRSVFPSRNCADIGQPDSLAIFNPYSEGLCSCPRSFPRQRGICRSLPSS